MKLKEFTTDFTNAVYSWLSLGDGALKLLIALTMLAICQVCIDVWLISEFKTIRELPTLPLRNQYASEYLAEQLAPFEKAAKEAELQKKAQEIQEEWLKLHPELAQPQLVATPSATVSTTPVKKKQ